MRHWKLLVFVAVVLIGAIVAIGVVSDGEDNDSRPTAPVGRITQMEQSGEMHEVLEKHRVMLQQMQDNASPAMLELMNNDPMWQMMRS